MAARLTKRLEKMAARRQASIDDILSLNGLTLADYQPGAMMLERAGEVKTLHEAIKALKKAGWM